MARPLQILMSALLAAVLIGGFATGPSAEAAARHQGPVVSLSGPTTSGSTISGSVDGIAPPVIGDEGAGAIVTVRMNGWIVENPPLRWNGAEQCWIFDYQIPGGQKGATVSISVTDAATGTVTTTTFTIA
ncbi:MAG: hypothetical protein R3F20_10675 [Planctomycetota bacterium]